MTHESGSEPGRFIEITIVLEREGSQWVSRCPELGTASCGDSMDEARENIREAVEVHLDALTHLGTLEHVLREKGLTLRTLEEGGQPLFSHLVLDIDPRIESFATRTLVQA